MNPIAQGCVSIAYANGISWIRLHAKPYKEMRDLKKDEAAD